MPTILFDLGFHTENKMILGAKSFRPLIRALDLHDNENWKVSKTLELIKRR